MPRQGSEGLVLDKRQGNRIRAFIQQTHVRPGSPRGTSVPEDWEAMTRSDYKRPQAQRRSNGSQGIPEASDLGARVRRCRKQCLAHTQLLLDNKVSDESICLGVGMVKAWMKHNQGRGKIL